MFHLLRLLVAAIVRIAVARATLTAENLLLRHQLVILQRSVKRPRLRACDRWTLAFVATRTRALLDAVLIVRPDTILRWHRTGWQRIWAKRSRGAAGRPPIDAELRALIRRLWRENVLWGENRIAGECEKLGWKVSPRTVAKYRPKGLEPAPRTTVVYVS